MSIIFHPIAAAAYLIHLGVNISLLLLLIQLVLTWRRPAWLAPLGTIGKPITAAMTGAVAARIEGRFRSRKLSERSKLSICIVLLILADLCLTAIARGMQ